ncbi:MAG: ABC-type polysaccharide/polyol phosphate export system, permease component, partial [Ilumatobacteraceae bacterium]|nr:ABC-type polysaccharide/polyol phosphate export system, permease component [Ilumatobacteraceae bacterium]
LIQPFLLVFVFTYVFPKIGNGPTGAAGSVFATTVVAGVLGLSIMFQGIQAVALPLVQEFGYTREIEDRVLAPLPVGMVAFEKVVAGALQGLLAALLVFPIAAVVPASNIRLHITWWVLLTLAPLSALACSSLGLFFGTKFDPRTVPLLFGIIVLPLTFLGCTYYSWTTLDPIKIGSFSWLKILVLINPLVYVSEGFRAAVTTNPHMSLAAVYPALIAFSALFLWQGIKGFKKRVLT